MCCVLGSCKEIVFAGLITCPWYWSTQSDRGLQAKYNNVFVVYKYKTEQLITPVTPHENEMNQVIDEVSSLLNKLYYKIFPCKDMY